LPRIVGARQRDVGRAKVEIAKQVAREANPKVRFEAIAGSVVDATVAHRLTDVDFLFLATDTMQSRLIFNANALVH
jgi:molybdopterin/thiamine biosynthesis adenylyltransferase